MDVRCHLPLEALVRLERAEKDAARSKRLRIVILAIGLLLFGRRLPEVGRSLGQGIIEFKKGLKGVTDDVEQASNQPTRTQQQIPAQSADPMQQRVDAQRSETKAS